MKAYLITMFILWVSKAAVRCVPNFKPPEWTHSTRAIQIIITIGFAIWTGILLFK